MLYGSEHGEVIRFMQTSLFAEESYELQFELSVLRALGPNVSGVGESKYTGPDVNRMAVCAPCTCFPHVLPTCAPCVCSLQMPLYIGGTANR